RAPPPTLFPYTTLFRSPGNDERHQYQAESGNPASRVADEGADVAAPLIHPVLPTENPLVPCRRSVAPAHAMPGWSGNGPTPATRSEEHTSELQSRENLV